MPATIQTIQKPTRARALDTSTSIQESKEMITDGYFPDSTNWTLGDDWTIGSNKATCTNDAGDSNGNLTQNHYSGSYVEGYGDQEHYEPGVTYRCTFTISDYNNHGAGSGGIRLLLYSNTYSTYGDGTEKVWVGIGSGVEANGTYTQDITISSDGGSNENQTLIQTNGDPLTISISNLSIRKLESFGNNNHGQIYSGRALEFDGISDALTFNPTKPTKNLTIAVWAYTSFSENWDTILGHNNGFSQYAWLSFYVTTSGKSGRLNAQINSASLPGGKISHIDLASADDLIIANTWYRCVLTWDTLSGANLYVNGVNVKTVAGTGDIDNDAGNLQIGRSAGSDYYFGGMMSDWQMWDATWTADDVLFDYNNPEQLALNRGGTSLTNSNLKIWYPMNDGHRGQQSYILDASNTGLGDELLTTTDLTTVGNQTITAGATLNGWTHHATYQFDSVTASSDGVRIVSNGTNDLGSAYQSFHTNPFVITEGKTYRLEYSFTVHSGSFALNVMNNPVGSSAGITRNGITGTENNTVKYFRASSNADASNYIEIYSASTNAFDATISYVSLKPVNDKNHATTTFYGDELISDEKNRVFGSSPDWTGGTANGSNTNNDFATYDEAATSGATEGDYFTDNYLKVISDDDASNIQYCWLDGANFGESNMEVGRRYRLQFSCQISYTKGNFYVGFGTAAGVVDGDADYAAAGNLAASTQTIDFTYKGDTDHAKLLVKVNTSTVVTAYLDNFTLKEIGTATGWTDADQQLDIPQTALQSYNQLAWFENDIQGANITNYVVASDNDALDVGTGDFSVSAWFYKYTIGTSGDSDYIFRKGGAGDEGYAGRVTGSGKISCNLDTDAGSNQWVDSAASVIEAGKWYHVVFSWDRSGKVYCYLNGGEITSGGFPATITGNSDTLDNGHGFYIGANSTSAGGFRGTVTEVALFKGAGSLLTEAHAKELYNDGKALDATTHSQKAYLAGYWRNNGLATWSDLSTNSNDASAGNITETMLITAGADSSRDSQGFLMNRQRTTNSLNLPFDVSDVAAGDSDTASYCLVNRGAGIDNIWTTAGSFTCWIYPESIGEGGYGRIFEKGAISHCFLQTESSGTSKLVFQVKFSVTGLLAFTTDASVITFNEWNYIAVTYDGSNDTNAALMYVNNTCVANTASETQDGTLVDDSDHHLYIGNRGNGGRTFEGQIDDLMFYSDILTALESGGSAAEAGDTITGGEVFRNYNAGKRSHK